MRWAGVLCIHACNSVIRASSGSNCAAGSAICGGKADVNVFSQIVKKYPPNYKRSAVMALLFLAQKQ
eukprot:774051-Rhodomonas_salina.2